MFRFPQSPVRCDELLKDHTAFTGGARVEAEVEFSWGTTEVKSGIPAIADAIVDREKIERPRGGAAIQCRPASLLPSIAAQPPQVSTPAHRF
jgi:hypothetical protein